MEENYPNRRKTLWEKEKFLITSNFFFSHSIFKRLVSLGRQKMSLCGNGLMTVRNKPLENIVGKGENASNQHFLLFPQYFQKACFPWASKGVIVWEWVNDPMEQAFWKHCGKRRKCWPAFSPFPTMFSTLPKENFNFLFTFKLLSANALNLERCKILSFGKDAALMILFVYDGRDKIERKGQVKQITIFFSFSKLLSKGLFDPQGW